VEQFLHAGHTPFGYTDLGKKLGHMCDSSMADGIYDGILKLDALSDPAIQAIVNQLKMHPLLVNIIKPVMTPEDFKSAFTCVPEKTASSLSGRGVHHYNACAKGLKDGLPDIICEVYAAMMTAPLKIGYYPERWKHAIDVMLVKTQGVSRSENLWTIQLLEVDLNQVLCVAFARNITKLSNQQEGIISEHPYDQAHKTCITPVLNKRSMVKLRIQKWTAQIVFDNDVNG
jgi:hypothetical protein